MKNFNLKTIIILLTTFNVLLLRQVVFSQIPYTNIKLEGLIKSKTKDSIEVKFRACKYPLENFGASQEQQKIIPVSNLGRFYIEIETNNLIYLTLSYKPSKGNKVKLFADYLAEPGDEINLAFPTRNTQKVKQQPVSMVSNIRFTGTGSEKFKCQSNLEENERMNYINWQNKNRHTPDTSVNAQLTEIVQFASHLDKDNHKILEKYKEEISDLGWQILKINLYANKMLRVYKQLKPIARKIKALSANSKNQFLINYYLATDLPPYFSSEALSLSSFYAPMLLLQYDFENLAFSKGEILSRINAISNQRIKDRVLAEYLLRNFNSLQSPIDLAREVLKNVSDTDYIKIINSTLATQGKGADISDFSLPNEKGETVKLSDFRGKVVFLDFWFTGCGGCLTYQKKVLSKVDKEFENNNKIVFISISIDIDRKMWLKSVESGAYSSDNVINLYTDGLGADHPIIKQLAITSYPRPIVIDKNGKIFNYNRSDLRISPERLTSTLYQAINSK